jgi:hypothetical protein
MCLAAWLTLATGVSFSEVGAVRLRGIIVAFWIAALALAIKYVSRAQAESRTT